MSPTRRKGLSRAAFKLIKPAIVQKPPRDVTTADLDAFHEIAVNWLRSVVHDIAERHGNGWLKAIEECKARFARSPRSELRFWAATQFARGMLQQNDGMVTTALSTRNDTTPCDAAK